MKTPKISVVLPCYNVEPYIGKCLDSLLAQTLSDIEIICVDDKSTDDTVSVINEYMARDKRIKLFSQPKNMGAGVARNTGRDMARGKYVSFIDPDDWVDENFYCELYRRASESDLDVVKAGMIYEYVETNETYTSTLNQLIKQNSMFFYGEHHNAIYKLKFLNDNNIYYPTDVMTGQDAVFLSVLVLANPKMDVVDSVFYHYFIERPGSLDSRKLGHKKVLSRIRMLDYKAEFLSNAKKLNDTDRQIYIEKHIFEHFIGAYHKEKEQSDDNKLLFDWLVAHRDLFGVKLLSKYYKQHQIRAIYKKDFKLFCLPEYRAHIFFKQRCPNGRRHIYFCGVKILSYKRHRTVRIPALKKCKYVHIMHNDKFIAPFVEFMNRHFNMDEHLFLCMHTCPQFPFPTGKNVVKIRDLRGIKLNRANIKQVICHSLFIPGLVDYLYQHQDILTHKAYWCIWGGDLYNAPRDAVNDFVRKNFYAYIGLMDREYALNKYGMRDNFYGANYIFPTLFGNDDVVIQKSEHPIRIQINNSADDSTLEMLDILSKFRDQDIEIYTILSYGKMEYRDQIIARGTELFGDKFHYLDKYLEPDEYKEFVKQNHILILNQNRQQGVGNTILNIQYGNKVFIRGDVSTYKYLNDVDGVKIFDSRKIGDMTFDEFIANDYVEQNRKNIREHTDEKLLLKLWNRCFNEEK